jgi:hypothetical protein
MIKEFNQDRPESKNVLVIIQYFARIKEMDRVGFEPTSSATTTSQERQLLK